MSFPEDVKGALQLALVPPLPPLHAQFHGPVPVTADAVPAVQNPAVGAAVTATPFAEPQAPLTATDCSEALHEEFVPPLLPLHVQAQGPVPVTVVEVPAVQRFDVGAAVRAAPLAEPQTPLTAVGCSGALHEEFAPPLLPPHVQAQGPLPVTAEAVPAEQRLVFGAVVTEMPFAEPQTPLTAVGCSGALHEEIAPPLLPLHVQDQGPDPVTAEAVPEEQRFVVGAVVTETPFAEPQNPLTSEAADCSGALHEELVPPLVPSHIQDQGPLPVTDVAVPAEQRFVLGALVTATPVAEPQTPLKAVETSGAEQDAVVPPP